MNESEAPAPSWHGDVAPPATGIRRREGVLLALATGVAVATGGVATRARAAEPDPASAPITAFYAVLLQTMKLAATLPTKARYEKLDPAVRTTFDLPAMTRIAVGPAWTSLPAESQQALVQQFSRMTIATYASRFDGYGGERLEVEPAAEERGANKVVHTRLVQVKGEPVVLNYLMHPTADGWKAIDVYLSGTISELATRRSEFGGLLRSGGAEGLITDLRQRTDTLLAR